MSKELFSQQIYHTIYSKLKLLEYREPVYFFEYDEYFELALCIAYMTLSKEKIINKEIKNDDRIGRLDKMVSTKDIDAIFDPSFNTEMPNITSALESDNLWILDNFRDSIMHAAFNVDMENKCFVINNTQDERKLQATIPFSWFVAYTKNHIFNKKILDKYTVQGFFYNDYKKTKTDINIYSEIYSHIMYEVVIKGNKFKVNEVEDRIRELFELYKHEQIDQNTFNNYQTKLPRTKNKYNQRYLTTFAVVCDKVTTKLKEEYPDLDIKIFVKDKKHKTAKRLVRKLDDTYSRYDTFMDSLNAQLYPRHKVELNYIANIISNLTPVDRETIKRDDESKRMLLFNQLLEDKNLKYTGYENERKRFFRNQEQARIICLTALAISTLVINQESIYNKFYDGHGPEQYKIIARTKKPLKENLEKFKSTHIELIQKQVQLADKENEYNNCSDETRKIIIKTDIDSLKQQVETLETNFNLLYGERIDHKQFTNTTTVDKTKRELEKIEILLKAQIANYKSIPQNTPKKEKKKTRKKILDNIKAIYNEYIKLEEKDAYWKVDDMKEALTIIRNCFSHLERIYVGHNKQLNTTIVLSDYDNSGNKSGEVITTYGNLLYILSRPLEDQYILKKTN